jgi:hypothetical protein
MGDLLGGDFDMVQKDNPYRYLDKLLAHKTDLFSFLPTTLEDPVRGQIRSPALRPNQHVFWMRSARSRQAAAWLQPGQTLRLRSSSDRVDRHPGLPLAYEVMPGNTSDKTALRDFLQRIEAQYGKAGRTWVMDRGIPDRGGAGRDAGSGDTDALPGRHAARTT